MKVKMLLAVCLLAVGLCLAPAVGYAQERGEDTKTAESRTPARYTYLIIPVDQKDVVYMKNMLFTLLLSFIYTHQKAEIPAEFRFWMMEAGIRGEDSDLFSSVPASLVPSLLLTVACESGYRIEHVTSGHIILVRPIYEEDLKELKDRLKGEG